MTKCASNKMSFTLSPAYRARVHDLGRVRPEPACFDANSTAHQRGSGVHGGHSILAEESSVRHGLPTPGCPAEQVADSKLGALNEGDDSPAYRGEGEDLVGRSLWSPVS